MVDPTSFLTQFLPDRLAQIQEKAKSRPVNACRPNFVSSRPDELIQLLKESLESYTIDPGSREEFKVSRKILKGYAQKGKLSDLQSVSIQALFSQKNIHTFKKDARCPESTEPSLLKLNLDIWRSINNEFILFTKMKNGGDKKEWEDFSSEQLFRFFLFIQEEIKTTPSLSSLRLEIFNTLLMRMMLSGDFPPPECFETFILPVWENEISANEKLKLESKCAKFVINRNPETLCVVAAWAAKMKMTGLLNSYFMTWANRLRCSASLTCTVECRYDLTSFKELTLEMLKVIGASVEKLHIFPLDGSKISSIVLERIASLCPNLELLHIVIMGDVPHLEHIDFTKFKKLNTLEIIPFDSDGWKSLQKLKIPAETTINHIRIPLNVKHLEECPSYDFLENLPAKGVELRFALRDRHGSFCYGFKNVGLFANVFRYLSHCTELKLIFSIIMESYKLLQYLSEHNKQLESLKLDYEHFCPDVDELRILKDVLPGLKKSEIRIKGGYWIMGYDDISRFITEWMDEQPSHTKVTLEGFS